MNGQDRSAPAEAVIRCAENNTPDSNLRKGGRTHNTGLDGNISERHDPSQTKQVAVLEHGHVVVVAI